MEDRHGHDEDDFFGGAFGDFFGGGFGDVNMNVQFESHTASQGTAGFMWGEVGS